MTDWHYKHLDSMACICNQHLKDASLPELSRHPYAEALAFIRGLRNLGPKLTSAHLELAFAQMRIACKAVRDCGCVSESGCQLWSCQRFSIANNQHNDANPR